MLKVVILTTLAAALALPAVGSEGEENFVLGVAFSKHLGKDGAAIYQAAEKKSSCWTNKWGDLGGCTTYYTEAKTRWYEFNPSIGFEKSKATEAGRERYFIQATRDSYGKFGLMGGYGTSLITSSSEDGYIDAGLAGGLWWRTNRLGDRNLTPFALPFISGLHGDSGIGFNLGVAPKIKVRGLVDVPTWTLMLQLKYMIR